MASEHFNTLAPTKGDSLRTLEAKILLAITGSSGDETSAAVTAGDYGGVTPTHTPAVAAQIAFDTSNGGIWNWYSSAWH